jgi:hypothetical protein
MRVKNTFLLALAFVVLPSWVAAETIVWTKQGYGCKSWDTVKELIGFVMKEDKAMFELGLTRYLSTGECTLLDPGDKIVIMERGFTSFRFRRDAQFDQYWVPKTAP